MSVDRLAEIYRPLRSSIFKFCEALRFEPTPQQVEALKLVQNETYGAPNHERKQRIAIKSGQGPGKTTVSTVIGLWRSFLDVGALTVVTAPSMRQCRDVWLAEARRIVSKADPFIQRMIEITRTRAIYCGDPDWGVWTMTAKDEVSAQGYHQENLTFIIEEASGVARKFLQQVKGTLSNPKALLFMIGNPNTRDCEFFDSFNSNRDLYHTLTFNAEDTARDRPDIVSPTRNLLLEKEYGRDSDVYRIRVLGEFPFADPNCVISSEDLEACAHVDQFYAAGIRRDDGVLDRQIALDFARYGGDETAIYRRMGNAIVQSFTRSHVDPGEAVSIAFRFQKDAGWRDTDTWYVPDASGMGQGTLHRFYDAGKNVHEFHNHGKPMSPDYANKVTEAWFHLAKLAKARNAHLPNDNTLFQQLSSRQYYTNKDGKLILEDKDRYMARGYPSPDRADAMVMAFYKYAYSPAKVSGRPSSRFVGEVR